MKTINFLTIFFVLSISIIAGCKKERIPPLSDLPGNDTPIFSIKGTIGNSTIDMTAGIDSAILETLYEQKQGVDFFIGTMTNQAQTFSIKISDGDIGTSSPVFKKSVPLQLYSPIEIQSWLIPNIDSAILDLSIQNVNFIINDKDVNEHLAIYQSGWHNICINITFNDQNQRRLCNSVLLGYKDLGYFVMHQKNDPTNSQTQLSIQNAQSTITSVKWFANNNLFSQESTCAIQNGQGIVEIIAEVTFNNGIVRRHTMFVDTDNHNRYFPDIHQFINHNNSIYYNDFKTSITFADSNDAPCGVSSQHLDIYGVLTIHEISEFGKTNTGNKIYKLKGDINGEYFDPNSASYVPISLKIVYGVESP